MWAVPFWMFGSLKTHITACAWGLPLAIQYVYHNVLFLPTNHQACFLWKIHQLYTENNQPQVLDLSDYLSDCIVLDNLKLFIRDH